MTHELHLFEVPQWIGLGELQARPTLPSHLYLLTSEEAQSGRLRLPWQLENPAWALGEWARQQQSLRPGNNVHSAKSWLCYHSLNPRAKILPQIDQPDVQRFSPVEVSALLLQHFRDAWNHEMAQATPEWRFEEQELVLTVPASFDEAAREHTLAAVEAAGLKHVVLLEEPQAAFYAWLAEHPQQGTYGPLREQFTTDESTVIVIDVGGGTSDFSLVKVRFPTDATSAPELERVAVSDHILLGGDNVDLALAAFVELELTGEQRKLSPRLWEALVGQCRRAKEALLSGENTQFPVTIAERGSRLIGRTRTFELTLAQLEKVVLDGFFPELGWEANSPTHAKQGLRTIGLPYAQDPAITRHLLHFLRTHWKEAQRPEDFPSCILFNGGTLEPPLLQQRLQTQLAAWREKVLGAAQREVRVLQSGSMHLAVARGAASFHLAREGSALRIAGGSARSYYVSLLLEGASKRLTERAWLCVLPQQAALDQTYDVEDRPLELTINQPVQFELCASSVRGHDATGALLQPTEAEFEESFTTLPPIQTFISVDKNRLPKKAKQLQILLRARLNEIGTLSLVCFSPALEQEWKLEFRIRDPADGSADSQPTLPDDLHNWEPPAEWETAVTTLKVWYGKKKHEGRLTSLYKQLEGDLQQPRAEWSLPLLRAIGDQMLAGMSTRIRSMPHELNWLKVAGFCLRPGFGFPQDEWRMRQVSEWLAQGPHFKDERTVEVEWWIFCRRVAAGLPAPTQEAILDKLEARLREAAKKTRGAKPAKGKGAKKTTTSPAALNELWLLAASLEEVSAERKVKLGEQLFERLRQGKSTGIEGWCLARLGARKLLHGSPLHVVSPTVATAWVEWLLRAESLLFAGELPLILSQIAQFVDDRHRDVSGELRQRLLDYVAPFDEDGRLERLLRDGFADDTNTSQSGLQNWLFGDELPVGLKLAASP